MQRKLVNISPTLPLIMGAFLLSGCVQTSYYARTKPKQTDIVGVWVVNSGSLQNMKAQGYKISNHQIILQQDGTYMIQNMPAYIFSDKAGAPRLKSQNGTWEMGNSQCDGDDCWWTIDFWSGGGSSLQANITGDAPPYSLEFVVGDWDESKFFYYEKKVKTSNVAQ